MHIHGNRRRPLIEWVSFRGVAVDEERNGERLGAVCACVRAVSEWTVRRISAFAAELEFSGMALKGLAHGSCRSYCSKGCCNGCFKTGGAYWKEPAGARFV